MLSIGEIFRTLISVSLCSIDVWLAVSELCKQFGQISFFWLLSPSFDNYSSDSYMKIDEAWLNGVWVHFIGVLCYFLRQFCFEIWACLVSSFIYFDELSLEVWAYEIETSFINAETYGLR